VSECRAQLERKLLRIDPTANTAVHSIDSLEPVRSSPLSLSLSSLDCRTVRSDCQPRPRFRLCGCATMRASTTQRTKSNNGKRAIPLPQAPLMHTRCWLLVTMQLLCALTNHR
jgi:hypothetical protein